MRTNNRLVRRRVTGTRNVVSALAVAASLAALAGCGSSDEGGSSAQTEPASGEAEVKTLIAAYPQASGAAPLPAAIDNGLDKKYGITLKTSYVDNSPAALALLVAGDAQIGLSSFLGVIDAKSQGIELDVVSQTLASTPGVVTLEVLPDSPIKGIRDFENKKVGIQAINTTQDMKIKYAMKKEGLDPAKVKFVELAFDQQLPALQRGTVDVALTTGITQKQAKEELKARRVWDFADGEFRGFAETGWVIPKAFAEKNPNTVARFQCAINEATELLKDKAEWAKVLKKNFGFDDATISVSPKADFPVGLDRAAVAKTPEMMKELGLIEEDVDVSSFTILTPENCDELAAG